MLYQDKRYLKAQAYTSLLTICENGFQIHFCIENTNAISQINSPFGGVQWFHKNATGWLEFWNAVLKQLVKKNIKTIEIRQAPFYYDSVVPIEKLLEVGFKKTIIDTNQYIPLTKLIPFHSMEQRILKKSNPFKMEKVGLEQLTEVHSFISACRQEQGLTINISLEKVKLLFELLPDNYELFTCRIETNLVAAILFCIPTPGIVYYYLPASASEFKEQSPMVHLLSHCLNHYRSKGYSIMDLGLSSIQGVNQNGLFTFKKRMGAQSTERATLILNL